MASRFQTLFKRTGTPLLVREFGETITYHPGDGSSDREISALIERDGPQLLNEMGVAVFEAIIRVKDSVTEGISATEIDTGSDEVSFQLRVGESAKRKAIMVVLSTVNGFVRFGVK